MDLTESLYRSLDAPLRLKQLFVRDQHKAHKSALKGALMLWHFLTGISAAHAH